MSTGFPQTVRNSLEMYRKDTYVKYHTLRCAVVKRELPSSGSLDQYAEAVDLGIL